MCSTVGPRRTAVERFMSFVASPDARDALGEGSGMTLATTPNPPPHDK